MKLPALAVLYLILSAQAAGPVPVLDPARQSEGTIQAGETLRFGLSLGAGTYVRVTVEQRGIDLAVRFENPGGRKLAEANRPGGTEVVEVLSLNAAEGGLHVLALEALATGAPAGGFAVRVEELRPAVPRDALRIAAERAEIEAGRLLKDRSAENLARAVDGYRGALARWRELEDEAKAAEMLYWMGVAQRLQGENRQSLETLGQALGKQREAGDRRAQALTLNQIGAGRWALAELDGAREAYEQAISLWRDLGEPQRASPALNNLGVLYQSQGQPRRALKAYREALEIFEQQGDTARIATALNHLGGIYTSLGEPLEALPLHEKALDLARTAETRVARAEALNYLGNLASQLGEGQTALDRFSAALALFRELGDRSGEATLLNNLSSQYVDLGELERAQALLRQALPLQTATGDRRGEAATYYNLGRCHSRSGEDARALEAFQKALALQREIGDRAGEAATLMALGQHLASLRPADAADPLTRALALYRDLGDVTGEARTLHSLGRAQAALGQAEAARASFEQALRSRRGVKDAPGEGDTLREIARLDLARGDPQAALARLEPAIELAESLRSRVAGDTLRTAYFASLGETYELGVRALMELHRRDPAAGFAARAFEVSERARARGLLDLLREARVEVRQGVDPQLLEQERRERLALAAKAERQTQILAGPHTPEEEAEAEREVEPLLAALRLTEARIRAQSPAYASLTRPEPPRLQDVQKSLDPDTLLLEYQLAEPRSFLWAVTPSSIESFELPAQSAVEAAARRAYELLSAPAAGSAAGRREALAGLGQMLLGPLAGRLEGKRLAVVAGGVLQYVPFAALSEPGAGEPLMPLMPLMVRHEVVSLPSAAVLAELRGNAAVRPRAEGRVAILADPVFGPEDPRVPARPGSSPAPSAGLAGPAADAGHAVRDLGESGLVRLSWTRREAEAIASEAGDGGLLLALGFDASREKATSPELGRYGIVHFATHGLVNSRHPELSGLVLSLLDPEGRPRDGFLRLRDVYNLSLNADLVVLSGCRTALGREVRGEGLLGLTRGFLYAGSSRVMASLWSVRDRATSELMGRFYRALLRDGRSPAAALRAAQISMWREPRWRDPYFWAGFVIQGDWRTRYQPIP